MNSTLRETYHFPNIPFNFGKNPFSFQGKSASRSLTLYFSQCWSFLTLWRFVSHNKFVVTRKYGYLFISHRKNFWKFPLEQTALAAMLTLSCGVQPCTHANSTLCSMRYWLVPLVTGLFLACFACYWLVPWLFRLLLTCSLLVPLVTGLFRLFRVLETSLSHTLLGKIDFLCLQCPIEGKFLFPCSNYRCTRRLVTFEYFNSGYPL